MRRFRCDIIPAVGADALLSAEVSHHLLAVTRLPRGQQLELFDGAGHTAVATLVGVEGGRARVRVEGHGQVERDIPLCLLVALTKGPRFEDALRMAVELGVTEVVPVLARRSVAKGDRRARWLRVIEGAARQSGRALCPQLQPLARFSEVLERPEGGLRWVCVPGAAAAAGTQGPASVLIGPEGGWTDAEVQAALAASWQPAGLGRHVLRAETAVAAALTRIRCAGAAPAG